MAFKEITLMDIWTLIRRWHAGQGIRFLSRTLGYDRKTVQRYTRLAEARGLSRDQPLPPKEDVIRLLDIEEGVLGRAPRAQTILEPYLQEIIALTTDKELALLPKSAFETLSDRHDLAGRVSYSSFKRFVQSHELALHPERLTCRRDEVEPGEEVQIDYGAICHHWDPEAERLRMLYAFIATLVHSRHKYVEFTYRQDQMSFALSHVRMFSWYGGVVKTEKIDNLKSGVIKPDLYDPRLNRTFAALIEHYDTFVDPARPASPKDKGGAEAAVKPVRQLGRRLIVENPKAPLGELNRLALDWCTKEYGMREHGTTHERPYEVFLARERPALKPLPEQPFEMVEWKQAKVHPDHYIQFRKKWYSVPDPYAGRTVWISAKGQLLQVFFNERLIQQHVITGRGRTTNWSNFPENVRAVLDTSRVHKELLERAAHIGPEFHELVRALLEIHAFINLRSALGITDLAEKLADPALIARAARFMTEHQMRATPKNLRALLEKLKAEDARYAVLPLSDATREFLRDGSYFAKEPKEQREQGDAA